MHKAIVVMGVSGCGKSSVGAAIATQLGGVYVDADDLHGPENVAHMAAGKALTDEMRWPWLDRCVDEVNRLRETTPTVLACSALKKTYRDHLRQGIEGLAVVYLDADRDLVLERMSKREGHYMPVSLLDSQFATLEVPNVQEGVVFVGIDGAVEDIAKNALHQLLIKAS